MERLPQAEQPTSSGRRGQLTAESEDGGERERIKAAKRRFSNRVQGQAVTHERVHVLWMRCTHPTQIAESGHR